MLDDVLHNLTEGLEGLAFSCRWGPRLQADFGDNEGLGGYCGTGFGESAEDWGRVSIGS